jgi:hypothetical protein
MATAKQGVPIGAVTRMTGVTGHTLRKWESRYGVVVPTRSDTGRRLYRQADIEKLLLVRDLVDRGHQISGLADKTIDELQSLLERAQRASEGRRGRSTSGPPLNVAVVGHIVVATVRLGAAQFAKTSHLHLHAVDVTQWLAHPTEAVGTMDAVILECATLPLTLVRAITELAATTRVMVVYGFSSSSVLRAVRNAGVICLRAPVTAVTLASALDARPEPEAAVPNGVPRFSRETIARVAGVAPSIHCECPQHVAQLLFDLGAFEQYSLECIDTQPHDRALHSYLHGVAASARALFEEALERVALAEGIELGE